MVYRNKTYVIFDADTDMRSYTLMKAWKENDHIEFDFHNAHELNNLRDWSSEDTIKRKLRERMGNAKQVVLLVGANTKNLHRFVRWEIELALEMDLPIVVVNLNNMRQMDPVRCPPIMRDKGMHVSFNPAIIMAALDDYATSYRNGGYRGSDYWFYKAEYYRSIGL